MKRTTFNKTMMVTSLAILVSSLTGCESPFSSETKDTNTEPVNVAVVNASNSNSVSLDLTELQPEIAEVCGSSGYFSYIVCDGDPFIVFHDAVQIESEGLSESTYMRRVNSKAAEMTDSISSAVPKTEEVDLLKAISLAAKDLSGRENPVIIVYSNGLSTTGVLDMTQLASVDQIDVTATVDKLKSSYSVPDLTNIEVQFYITETAGSQLPLSDKEERMLSDLWKGIVEAGGGVYTPSYYLPDNVSVLDSAPSVSPVAVSDIESDVVEVTLDDIPEELPENFEITIDEEAIAFVAGTAEVMDEKLARSKIAPLAETIISNNIDIALIGSTATVGDAQSSVVLSEERCQTIASLLRDAGVTTNIVIKGYGYSDSNPYYTCDVQDGVLVEEIAATNRKVVIIGLNSDQAKKILG